MNRTAVLTVAVLLAAMPASAHDEADAPTVDARIEAVWHEPAVPAPGQQWQGWLRLVADHNVTEVYYQVCNVGVACVAPPTPAERVDDRTWTYDTADYTDALGNPVPWGDERQSGGEDWRVGTQFWIRQEGDGPDAGFRPLPHGLELDDPACEGRYQECSETHYFSWDMPAGPVGPAGEGAPGPGMLVLLSLAGALAVARRRAGRS